MRVAWSLVGALVIASGGALGCVDSTVDDGGDTQLADELGDETGDGDGDESESAGTGTGTSTDTDDATTGDGDGDPTDTTAGDSDGDPDTSTDTDTGDPGNPYDAAAEHCVAVINMYRATLDLAPLERWTDAEECSNGEAESDAMTNTPHGAFGTCGEWAQNECPGWPGPPEQLLDGCLAAMWAEGPGEDFQQHGHYINMSNPSYTRVACGFHQTGQGDYWAVQNFQ